MSLESTMSGRKRPASPIDDGTANLFDVDLSDEDAKKLEDIQAEVLRADLITGKSSSFLLTRIFHAV